MIGWVRPQIAHPGAWRGAAHGRARRAGAPPRHRQGGAVSQTATLIRLAPGSPRQSIDEVPAGRLYKDGTLLVERRGAHRRGPPPARLRRGGVGRARVSDRGRACRRSRGRADRHSARPTDEGQLIADLAYDAALEAFESMPRARRRDPEAVAESVRRAVRAAISRPGARSRCVTCTCSRCSSDRAAGYG